MLTLIQSLKSFIKRNIDEHMLRYIIGTQIRNRYIIGTQIHNRYIIGTQIHNRYTILINTCLGKHA